VGPDLGLNLGYGGTPLPGWVNLDSVPYPGVDRVLDLKRGIPCTGAAFIPDNAVGLKGRPVE
jgi:hypothetical protein